MKSRVCCWSISQSVMDRQMVDRITHPEEMRMRNYSGNLTQVRAHMEHDQLRERFYLPVEATAEQELQIWNTIPARECGCALSVCHEL